MRYLVFNLLVVGALGFLLFDGEPPATVREAVDKVAAKADRLVQQGKALVEQTETARPARAPRRPPPAAEAAQSPPPAAVAAPSRPVAAAPQPAKPPKTRAAPARALAPDVARRRAEILGEAPDDDAAGGAATAEFMTPRVRRGELSRLAEDMELMFVEKVSR